MFSITSQIALIDEKDRPIYINESNHLNLRDAYLQMNETCQIQLSNLVFILKNKKLSYKEKQRVRQNIDVYIKLASDLANDIINLRNDFETDV